MHRACPPQQVRSTESKGCAAAKGDYTAGQNTGAPCLSVGSSSMSSYTWPFRSSSCWLTEGSWQVRGGGTSR